MSKAHLAAALAVLAAAAAANLHAVHLELPEAAASDGDPAEATANVAA